MGDASTASTAAAPAVAQPTTITIPANPTPAQLAAAQAQIAAATAQVQAQQQALTMATLQPLVGIVGGTNWNTIVSAVRAQAPSLTGDLAIHCNAFLNVADNLANCFASQTAAAAPQA